MTIPNIFHFINLGPRQFNLIHFLAIRSAYENNNPDKIYVYVTQIQKNNIFWEALKDIITVVIVDDLEEFRGIPIKSYQYKADILRLEQLIDKGGIYMDLDMLTLKPLTGFLSMNLVMGAECADDPESSNLEEIGSLSNAIIMAEPNNDFLKHWYSILDKNILDKPWAYHAVCLPKKILLEEQFDATIMPTKTFIPFCFRKHYVMRDNLKHKRINLVDSYTMHLWETIWSPDWLSRIDIEFFNRRNNLFVEFFGKHVDPLFKHLDELEKIIKTCFEKQYFIKLFKYCKLYIDLCTRFNKRPKEIVEEYHQISRDIIKNW